MNGTVWERLSGPELMSAYGFARIGSITLPDSKSFVLKINPNAALWEKSLYIFMFGDAIMRVGSSKGKLGTRMQQWQRDVTIALREENTRKTPTPHWEAQAWKEMLELHGEGAVYAREATEVITPVGKFRAYMDEESILINRHRPTMNRHKNR